MTTLNMGLKMTLLTVALVAHAANVSAAVIDDVRSELMKKNTDPGGRPLPVAASWSTGSYENLPVDDRFSPDFFLDLLASGNYVLPSFDVFSSAADAGKPCGRGYNNETILRAKKLQAPISLIATQIEQDLYTITEFAAIDVSDGIFTGDQAAKSLNPCLIQTNGKIVKKLSPFGPEGQVQLWYDLGKRYARSEQMRNFQALYPDPPMILFMLNNESKKLQWTEVETSRQYRELFIDAGKESEMDVATRDDFRRRMVGDGFIIRYRAMISGFRENLSTKWAAAIVIGGYAANGPASMNRWSGWMAYSLVSAYSSDGTMKPRFNPWHEAWEGTSASFYLDDWQGISDFKVHSPQIEYMNVIFSKAEDEKHNPQFWFELSTWHGEQKKFDWYRTIGQEFTPARYKGFVQFGMWMFRPRTVREFYGWSKSRSYMMPYFEKILESVGAIHKSSTRASFWRNSTMVENPNGKHPFQQAIHPAFTDDAIEARYGVGRWYLLDTKPGPIGFPPAKEISVPTLLAIEIPVFALAFVRGEVGTRTWLLYAHAPKGDMDAVGITVPGFGDITVAVKQEGSFILIDEEKRAAIPQSSN